MLPVFVHVQTLDAAIAAGGEVALSLRDGSTVYCRPVTLDHEHVIIALRGGRPALDHTTRVHLGDVRAARPIGSWSASA